MTQPPLSHLPPNTNTAAPAPLAELRGVATGRGLPPLQDVNFVLQSGEAWLISGPNGGGKSTFLKLLRGELSPIRGSRRYLLDGQERTSAVRARQALALISPEQEAFYLTRDWAQTVSDVLLSGLSGDALRLWEAEAEALARRDEVAAQLNLGGLLERDFRTLSHGQRRRALLGRALMSRPAALLLDEFTDGLSVAARAELRGVLEALWRAGTAIVLVTHRPEEAPRLGWRHARVEAGRLTLDAAPPTTMPRPHSFSLPAPTTTGQVLVQLKEAEVYRNGHHALGPLSWTWREGQHWLVTGENGSGKSTLARLIAGAFHPALGGSVTRPFLRRDLLSERQRQIGLIGAEVAIRQRRDWTGLEVIGSAFGGTEGFSHPLTPGERRDVEQLAGKLGASDLLERPADTLSQGQLRRLLLARALVHRPRLLILDEGLDFLDAASRAEVMTLLMERMRGGTSLLVIAHREEDAPPGLTHHLRLEAGKILEETT
ncbi:ATP-binding cassette domain-containing protein [Deinococcus sp.]|uniref:ATP-binding cassette domain-containing protein n=1 Tax=Deinococcus sp. TaxID=47478 RepID=UPI003B5B9C8A